MHVPAAATDVPPTVLRVASAAAGASEQIQQLPAPSVTAQRVHLKPGHYALRHLGFAPGIAPKGGLPFGIVQALNGDVVISAHVGVQTPALREPNDTIMVSVGARGAEILVACFNHPGAQGAGFRFMLAPLALPEVAVGAVAEASSGRTVQTVHATPVAEPPRSQVTPSVKKAPNADVPHLVAVGHSERLGDVSYGTGEWVGGVGNVSLRLEGFTLHMRNAPLGLALEYGAADRDGNVTWAREGALAGSRGRAAPIFGVAARLLGAAAGDWSISYECRFSNGAGTVAGRDGEVCLSRIQATHLAAVKFSVQRRTAETRDVVRGDRVDLSQVRILAHIEREGDRVFKFGEWVGTPGSGRSIEGLQVLEPVGIEAAHVYDSVTPRRWVPLVDFFGSRGRSAPILPLSFRMTRATAGGRLIALSKFVGDPTLYSSDDTSEVFPPRGARLEAFRLAVQ